MFLKELPKIVIKSRKTLKHVYLLETAGTANNDCYTEEIAKYRKIEVLLYEYIHIYWEYPFSNVRIHTSISMHIQR